ncbi:hypothetical protein JF737_23460 [Mycobacterium avium]|uniref:hypothetical protein n=1 Tax=Mycobacterium avium TaxID=1764 RepID=UPI001CD96CAF|nr:hypothetical protein [Mycobacterium avium]MCA2271180.1 hypothetical protein [Mycobacterium avium]MCA2281769.1 hypothetical protein [Mycobacterium avium]MCA2286686.1 hypothetical protein [Mycobacterium avium]MCA2291495.1 hypothetical protein [Mycobacterium avium]MCA2301587.1 hypothetical protein [Mycobacterium avium]
MPYRSAITGRYITKAAAARHPKTSVRESPGSSGGSGNHYRSAVNGQYVPAAEAAKHPKTTLREKG